MKYVFKINLSRQEMNGSFFYVFPYGKPELENLLRRLGHKEPDLRLSNYVPYLEEMNECDEFKYLHRYNSLGLRGKNPLRDTAKTNIVGLGDSYTEGVGTPEDSTWLQLVENNLNDTRRGQLKNIQCINGGIMGNEPIAEYIILKELLLPYKPRVVILAVNCTDISEIVELGGWERFNNNHRKIPWYAYIYQFSFITRAVVHIMHPINWLFLTHEEYREAEKDAFEILEQCIAGDYLKLSREQNFKLIVVLHPVLSELEQNSFLLQPLAAKLQKLPEIKTINLFEAFKKTNQQSDIEYKSLYWLRDGHNNSRGYQLWADHTSPEVDLMLRETLQN